MPQNNYVPPWLDKIMSESDREIAQHRRAQFLKVDPDGTRLPAHQQYIESPVGSMVIDSRQKAIIGYGPPSAPRIYWP